MAIFRYTMVKFLKTPSTWVLFVFCGGLLFWISGLPFHTWGRNWNFKSVAEQQYDMKTAFIASYSALGSILALSIALFAGFKGAQVFRDEIEDGSFLIVLSKPLSRRKIIFWKWLAFMTLFLVYGFALAFLHAIGSLSEMKGTYIKNKIFAAMPLEFLIIVIFVIIFSSIALIFSTFLSSRGVMGVMFVFGLGIVFSQLISAFTYIPAFTKFDVTKHIGKTETANELYARQKTLVNKNLLTSKPSDLFLTKHNLYISNPNSVNTYKNLWFFDLSYHINMMDSIVVDTVLHNNMQHKNTFGIPQKVEFNGYYDNQELTTMEQYNFLSGNKYENMNIILNQFEISSNQTLWNATRYLLAETNDYINHNLSAIAGSGTKLTLSLFNNKFYNSTYKTTSTYGAKTGDLIAQDWKTVMSSGILKTTPKQISISKNNNLLSLFSVLDNSDYRFSANQSQDPSITNGVKNNVLSLLMGYFQTDAIQKQISSWSITHSHSLRVSYYNLMTSGSEELSKIATHLNIKVKSNADGTLNKDSIHKLENQIIKVKFVNFTSRYNILAIYIVLSVVMVPLTFWLICRKDFS